MLIVHTRNHCTTSAAATHLPYKHPTEVTSIYNKSEVETKAEPDFNPNANNYLSRALYKTREKYWLYALKSNTRGILLDACPKVEYSGILDACQP